MRMSRRDWLAGTGGLLVTACGLGPILAAGDRTGEVIALGGSAFGTYWRIALSGAADAHAIRAHIEGIIASVDQSMSPFRAGTEISIFNAMNAAAPFPASPGFATVVAESLRIAALSDGAFDPTVGPLVNRYGFGPIRGDTQASFADITASNAGIAKARRAVTLDLCGIAKGYALDEIVRKLDTLGARNFIVEIGGEVFARGTHPQGRPWQVAIERPAPGAGLAQRVMQLDDCAIASSGDAANAYAFADRRYSHIIDARRSAPVDNAIASVSVIARTAMEADALATAMVALGVSKARAFATRHNVPTLILIRDDDRIQDVALAGFDAFILG